MAEVTAKDILLSNLQLYDKLIKDYLENKLKESGNLSTEDLTQIVKDINELKKKSSVEINYATDAEIDKILGGMN